MNKKIIAMIVLVLAIIVAGVYYCNFKNGTVANSATVEGYIKQVHLDDDNSNILICYDLKNTLKEEYLGDCYIPIEANTIISDGRTLDSLKQGEHIIATYTGTLAETWPGEIDGTVLIQFIQ